MARHGDCQRASSMLERSLAMQFCEFRIQLRRSTVVATFSGDLVVDGVPRGPATKPLELRLGGIHRQAVEVLSALVERDRAERDELKLLGCFLYDLLFQGEVRERFEKVYEAVKNTDDHVLRVVLDFEDGGHFSGLPWEYLYLPDYDERPRGVFLATVSTMVLSRHVQLAFDATRAADRIKILGVVSSPRNIADKVIADPVIDELEKLSGKPGDDGGSRAEFDVLRQPTRDEFKAKLRDYQPHVLHFAGHGKVENNQGFIGLCRDGTDRVDWLRGSDLPDLLGERRRLRLVVLHACEGAASSGLDGVAHHLVKAAVPAVIAMRYEIDNAAALEFSTTFYRVLAEGWPVDAAVQRGREAIAQMEGEEHYRDRRFGTPVVFLRSEDFSTDHRIIEPLRKVDEEERPAGVAPGPAPGGQMPCPFCGRSVNAGGRYCPNVQCNRPFHICPDCGSKAIPVPVPRCEDCEERVRPRVAVQGGDRDVVPLEFDPPEGPLAGREPGVAAGGDDAPTARPHELRERMKPDG